MIHDTFTAIPDTISNLGYPSGLPAPADFVQQMLTPNISIIERLDRIEVQLDKMQKELETLFEVLDLIRRYHE